MDEESSRKEEIKGISYYNTSFFVQAYNALLNCLGLGRSSVDRPCIMPQESSSTSSSSEQKDTEESPPDPPPTTTTDPPADPPTDINSDPPTDTALALSLARRRTPPVSSGGGGKINTAPSN